MGLARGSAQSANDPARRAHGTHGRLILCVHSEDVSDPVKGSLRWSWWTGDQMIFFRVFRVSRGQMNSVNVYNGVPCSSACPRVDLLCKIEARASEFSQENNPRTIRVGKLWIRNAEYADSAGSSKGTGYSHHAVKTGFGGTILYFWRNPGRCVVLHRSRFLLPPRGILRARFFNHRLRG